MLCIVEFIVSACSLRAGDPGVRPQRLFIARLGTDSGNHSASVLVSICQSCCLAPAMKTSDVVTTSNCLTILSVVLLASMIEGLGVLDVAHQH